MESASVLGRRARIIFGQRVRDIAINNLLLLRRFGAIGMVNLSAAEVSVLGTLQVHVVQHAFIVDSLSGAAAKKFI